MILASLRRLTKVLPTFLLAFALALAVWLIAVTASDPNVKQVYPRAVPIQIMGQDPGLILVDQAAKQVTLTINAPKSIWDRLSNETGLVTATVDLSGLGAGTHSVPVQVQIQNNLRPIQVVTKTPETITVTLEDLLTNTFPVNLVVQGDAAIGFQAGTPTLSAKTITVSGPASLMQRVKEVRASLDLNQANQNIVTSLTLQAVDANESAISGLTLSPDKVDVSIPVTQLGGYRDVVVKVVMSGQVTKGYRLTNISIFPPVVTVFSSNPQDVNNLPGFVETQPVDITNAKDDLDLRVPLNLPTGISVVGAGGVPVVGQQTVLVQVGIAAIESSLTLSNMQVTVVGLDPTLTASISPQTVVVILSGPLPLLDALSASGVEVTVDLTGKGIGTYQVTPQVNPPSPDLHVELILPATLEVTVTVAPTPTRTPRP